MDRLNGFPFENAANGTAQGRSPAARAFTSQMARYRQAILQVISPEDVQAIARMLVRQSSSGNLAAARLLFSYAIGQPTARARPRARKG